MQSGGTQGESITGGGWCGLYGCMDVQTDLIAEEPPGILDTEASRCSHDVQGIRVYP
jgi:hypothetical protein